MVRANENCSRTTFIEADICYRMGPLRMLYSVTTDLNFQGQTFQVTILTNNRRHLFIIM